MQLGKVLHLSHKNYVHKLVWTFQLAYNTLCVINDAFHHFKSVTMCEDSEQREKCFYEITSSKTTMKQCLVTGMLKIQKTVPSSLQPPYACINRVLLHYNTMKMVPLKGNIFEWSKITATCYQVFSLRSEVWGLGPQPGIFKVIRSLFQCERVLGPHTDNFNDANKSYI